MNKIFAAVLVMLIAAPAFAAPAGSNRQAYEKLKASNPQDYQRCRDLARERGFKGGDENLGPARRFIRKCMQGTQR
jgi:hypothetical protein